MASIARNFMGWTLISECGRCNESEHLGACCSPVEAELKCGSTKGYFLVIMRSDVVMRLHMERCIISDGLFSPLFGSI